MIIAIASLVHQLMPVLIASDPFTKPSPRSVRVPKSALITSALKRIRTNRPTSPKLPSFGSIRHRPLSTAAALTKGRFSRITPGIPHQERIGRW